jgi:5-methylcytosine-specific restriction endonuclease McrA
MQRKQPRLRLEREAYKLLRTEVLERDGWRCLSCGASSNLQVHHKKSRGHLGHDQADNLMTLYHRCHGDLHQNLKDHVQINISK